MEALKVNAYSMVFLAVLTYSSSARTVETSSISIGSSICSLMDSLSDWKALFMRGPFLS